MFAKPKGVFPCQMYSHAFAIDGDLRSLRHPASMDRFLMRAAPQAWEPWSNHSCPWAYSWDEWDVKPHIHRGPARARKKRHLARALAWFVSLAAVSFSSYFAGQTLLLSTLRGTA